MYARFNRGFRLSPLAFPRAPAMFKRLFSYSLLSFHSYRRADVPWSVCNTVQLNLVFSSAIEVGFTVIYIVILYVFELNASNIIGSVCQSGAVC